MFTFLKQTWIVTETAEGRTTDPDCGDHSARLGVQHHQMTLRGPGGQRHAERMEAERDTLVRHLRH